MARRGQMAPRLGMGYVLLLALWDAALGFAIQFLVLWLVATLISPLSGRAGLAAVAMWTLWAATIRLVLLVVLFRLQNPPMVRQLHSGEIELRSERRLTGAHAFITGLAVAIPLLVTGLAAWKVAVLTFVCTAAIDGLRYAGRPKVGGAAEE